ncbi:response regulator [Ramlibacter sp.]|uniref:sensor histidine kinase n=1 Tax=Ramlibacter sp. TaxID=1917967 RepID=UPI0017ADDA86|nr:response regulator [Ramlibacter sp.]MBA2674765.1 response regulator [Ramlibacter sp.]
MNSAAAGSAGTILIVDDTRANIRLLAEHLEDQGFAVVVAQDGEEGVQRARRVRPDLVLLDVNMQGLGGFETCRRLKAEPATRHVPVIFATVLADTRSKIAAFEAGAADYVTKPFHIDEVLARVNTQLGLARAQAQLARQNALLQQEVAERMRAEEQVRLLNAELEARVDQRTAQLETANQELRSFCYSIAHDLRGPLGAIDGFSCLLEETMRSAADARGRHFLDRIRTGVRQMDELTEALLTLAHLSLREQQRERVDLGALARAALQKRAVQQPQRSVQVEVQTGLEVQADGALMAQAMEHLVDNAWKFTGREPCAHIAIGRAAEDAGGAYYVRDNGAGFDMAYADKLFKPFQRLHGTSEFPGLGIGLAMVERIVSRHGGRVWAQAAPGRGAAFYFTLP